MRDEPVPDDVHGVISPTLARHGGLIAVFDSNDRVRWANGAYRTAMGIPVGSCQTWCEIMRWSHDHSVGAVIETSDFDGWLISAASRRGKQPYRQFEVDLRDGRWLLMSQTVDSHGWLLEMAVDISDLGRPSRELRIARDLALRASQVDSLTGIGNRAFVLHRLEEALAGHADQMPCVVLIDIDHFKRVNDWLGHAAGDDTLKHFARTLQDSMRRTDSCGRVGGEEFLLILNAIAPSQAEEIVTAILSRVSSARPLEDRPGFHYTASAGLTRARVGEPVETVLARADAALYRAKDAGRDRCVRSD